MGIPLGASVYRRLTGTRAPSEGLRFVVRASVDNDLVLGLAELVRAVQGRAVFEGGDAFSVPLAEGVSKNDAYRDLRAVLDKWELQHPGIRLQILDGQASVDDRRQRQRSQTHA